MSSPTDIKPLTLAVLIFDQADTVDFAGPLDIFSYATTSSNPSQKLFSPAIILAPTHTSTTVQNLRIARDADLSSPADVDVLLIPGGYGVHSTLLNPAAINLVKTFKGKWIISVCTGALLLTASGVLDGLEGTTHHTAFDKMEALGNGKVTVVRGSRAVISRKAEDGVVGIVTAGGVTSGFDAALELLKIEFGTEVAGRAAKTVEYEWRPL